MYPSAKGRQVETARLLRSQGQQQQTTLEAPDCPTLVECRSAGATQPVPKHKRRAIPVPWEREEARGVALCVQHEAGSRQRPTTGAPYRPGYILPVVLRSPSSTPTSHPRERNGNHSSRGQGCTIPTSSFLEPEPAGCQSTQALSIPRSDSQWGRYTRPAHGKHRCQWGSGMCHGSLTACRVLPPAGQ